jgi:hypothetical protein
MNSKSSDATGCSYGDSKVTVYGVDSLLTVYDIDGTVLFWIVLDRESKAWSQLSRLKAGKYGRGADGGIRTLNPCGTCF